MSPNTLIDLHVHTYYSDGQASPAELLYHAASLGLKTVAITDHDNMHAFQEASIVAQSLGIELVPGVEMTSHWEECPSPDRSKKGQDINILGYFVDPQDNGFNEFTRIALADSRSRVEECCARLTKAGYPLSIFDVLDENPRYVGAAQMIAALCRKGFSTDWKSGLMLFLEYSRTVHPCSQTVEQVIGAIHAAGGVTILAHPISIDSGSGWLQADQLRTLTEIGLDGLEVYHPRLDYDARQHFLTLANSFNLLVSGGSDEHGGGGTFPRLGCEPLGYQILHAIRQRTLSYRPA
jgi:predicted metal-dependent phosphoesterase TrpH